MFKCFLLILFFIPFLLASQTIEKKIEDKNILESRKKQLFFRLGSEFRITPLPNDGASLENYAVFTNVDLLHSGPALSYGLDFFLSKNLSLSLDHSFRYRTLLYDFNQLGEILSASKSQKELLQGFHLSLTRYFKISSKGDEIFFRIGISSFNGGSDFVFVEPIGDIDDPLWIQSQLSFRNFGTNFAIGYRKSRVSVMAGLYLSSGGAFYTTSFRIVTPYIKFSYALGKL